MTTLTDRPTTTENLKQAPSGKRFLVIAVVVLALTSIGLNLTGKVAGSYL